MIHLPRPAIGRRPLMLGAAGTAMALAARVPVRAQPAPPPAGAPGAPPATTPGAPGAPSAVIDVNRARAAPIPIAIPDFVGSDGDSAQLGREIAGVITNDLGNCGLFKPLPPASFVNVPPGAGQIPNFQNWGAIGAQALVTGAAEVQGGGNIRVEFRLWDVLPQAQIQGTAYTTTQSNWRRIAHIIADVIYQRLLGESGYFDTRVCYVAATGPLGRQTKRLAIMDQDGANNRYLTDGRWLVLTPRFNPVKDEIAFMSFAYERPRVYLFNLQTGHQSILGDFPGMTLSPRFSPDGSRVVMSLTEGSGAAIVAMDLASRATQRLTNADSINVSPCYSPDGSRIAFNSDRDGDQQLYVMNADGSGVNRISFGRGRYATPVWSPRGDLIAYTSFGGDTGAAFNIGVMQPDGKGERILAQGWDVEGPTWAPGGMVMMFQSSTRSLNARGQGYSSHLITVDNTGFNQRTIVTPTNATDPAWSPLGM
ncbi:MAG TPA: Tol-Pal system beta propeller repeat protein TolB [Acetobacteraceae bacterium]|nr:Tol-Pal system beta propeller repeat protein TolB [Acetobacteraceae bacterium]